MSGAAVAAEVAGRDLRLSQCDLGIQPGRVEVGVHDFPGLLPSLRFV
jgi:hypothetical protein